MKNKKIVFRIRITALILLPVLLWLVWGGAGMIRYKIIETYFDTPSQTPDEMRSILIAEKKQIELMRELLSPEEFKIWKENFDLRDEGDEGKEPQTEKGRKTRTESMLRVMRNQRAMEKQYLLDGKEYKIYQTEHLSPFAEDTTQEKQRNNYEPRQSQ